MAGLSKINAVRVVLISSGIACLMVSFLCFIYIIQVPMFDVCGSYCEYWWSWIVDIPPQGICIMICMPRNWLYKPLFVIGAVLIAIEVLMEVLRIVKDVSGR